MAILISIFLLIAYFILIYSFSKEFWSAFNTIKSSSYKILYIFLLIIPTAALFYITTNEKFVYYWDFANYWIKSINFTESFFHNPMATIRAIYSSINYENYNTSANLLLAPTQELFAPINYNIYISSIYLMYSLPLTFVLSSFIYKLYNDFSTKTKLVIPVCIALFTPLLIPIRYGFLDIAGVFWLVIVFDLYIDTNYLKDNNIRKNIGIALLLLIIVFTRRFYAFWVVAFFLSSFLISLFFYAKSRNTKEFIITILNLTIIGTIFTAILVLFFYPFFEMSVLKDYKDIYSAYTSRPFFQETKFVISYYGIAILAISFIGWFYNILKKNIFIIFLSIFTIITVYLFTRINYFGFQHHYLTIPFFIITFISVFRFFKNKQIYVAVGIPLILLINNAVVFAFNNEPQNNNVALFSKVKGKSHYRTDYEQIVELSKFVLNLKEKNQTAYCLSSGYKLNEATIRLLYLPNKDPLADVLYYTQDVDKRDRFPIELFLADYVITTNPIDLHLGENNQQVVAYFNNQILNGLLKENYTIVKTFSLEDDVKAIILKKLKNVSNTQIDEIKNHFKKLYPEYENMYAISALLYIENTNAGDNYGSISISDAGKSVMIHPGMNIPSKIDFNFEDTDYKKLSFTTTFNNKTAINQECNPNQDAEIYLTIKAEDSIINTYYITHKNDQRISFQIPENRKITIEVDKGKNEDYCDWFKITDFIIE